MITQGGHSPCKRDATLPKQIHTPFNHPKPMAAFDDIRTPKPPSAPATEGEPACMVPGEASGDDLSTVVSGLRTQVDLLWGIVTQQQQQLNALLQEQQAVAADDGKLFFNLKDHSKKEIYLYLIQGLDDHLFDGSIEQLVRFLSKRTNLGSSSAIHAQIHLYK